MMDDAPFTDDFSSVSTLRAQEKLLNYQNNGENLENHSKLSLF
jgi:hypothetical protein